MLPTRRTCTSRPSGRRSTGGASGHGRFPANPVYNRPSAPDNRLGTDPKRPRFQRDPTRRALMFRLVGLLLLVSAALLAGRLAAQDAKKVRAQPDLEKLFRQADTNKDG